MPLFTCIEWQCEIQDSEMVVIGQLCFLRRSVQSRYSCVIICRLLVPNEEREEC